MIRAGVIGHPIAHSLSPKLHNYWLKKYNIEGEYIAYDVAPEDLRSWIKSMPEKGFAGCNVTIPYKEEVFSLLGGNVDGIALRLGAVNTVVVEGSRIIGLNTDAYGFTQNIAPYIKRLEKKEKAVVLGAGGAANAVWESLISLGFKEVALTNRTHEKFKDKEPLLKSIFAKNQGTTHQIYEWLDFDSMFKDADLLVNTTSLGMAGKEPLDISLDALPKTALVTDIVYRPLMTPLLVAAKARGNPVVDGLGMLLHQAAPGFKAWFGVMPEVTSELRQFILAS
ncbi:MAG: shikimate dehydrogenase [Alphaproteobacteria bacterium]|nr:shikimate dehydrogenase [Alphaproteobacteria bacterium]